MDLLIDIGNTNLKWARCQAGVVGEMQTVRHHGGLPIDVHAAWEYLDTPRRVLVGSVGGEAVANALKRTCRSRWRIDPRFARTKLFAMALRSPTTGPIGLAWTVGWQCSRPIAAAPDPCSWLTPVPR